MHYDNAIYESTGKSEIVIVYNSSKSGTNSFDQLVHLYSVARKTSRWPKRMLFGVLDMAGINAVTLHVTKTQSLKTRRSDLLYRLGCSLVNLHLKKRLESTTLRRAIKVSIREILGAASRPGSSACPASDQGAFLSL